MVELMYNISFVGRASVFVMPLFLFFLDTIGQDPLQKGVMYFLTTFLWTLHLVTNPLSLESGHDQHPISDH
jgi:hypothetical protein